MAYIWLRYQCSLGAPP